MADEADISAADQELFNDVALRNARATAAAIPEGAPGECELCGEWAGRLVEGVCAPCRDRYGLP